jgi:hypothetical protein
MGTLGYMSGITVFRLEYNRLEGLWQQYFAWDVRPAENKAYARYSERSNYFAVFRKEIVSYVH